MFYSQAGQDKWVCELFKYKRDGFFLDIGAFDGKTISNTYTLEKELGWRGILIEPNPIEFAKLIKCRSNPAEQICITPVQGPVSFIMNGWFSAADAEYSDDDAKDGNTKGDNGADGKRERIEVQGFKIETILAKYSAPAVIDYVSLDIEGGELALLETFPFDIFRMRALTVEHNAYKGWKNQVKRGAIKKLMLSNGYQFHHTHEDDDYYVDQEIA